MDFGEILTKAWKIIWKHKILWVFGILASLGSGSGGGNGGGGGGSSSNFNFQGNLNGKDFNLPPEFQQSMNRFSEIMSHVQWWMIALIILGLLVISLIFYAISVIGRNGLILGAKHADEGAEKLTFGELFSESLKYFWRIFWFSILAGIALFVVLMIIMIPMMVLGVLTMGILMLCMIPLICVLIPVFMLVGVVIQQAIIAMVADNLGMIDGLKRGWNVFKANFWNLVLLAIILGVISAVIGFIISLPMLIAFLPLALPMINAMSSGSFDYTLFTTTGLISLGLCCVLTPIIMFLNGVLTSYVESAWTLAYLRLTRKPSAPVMTIPEIPGEVPPVPNPS